MRTDPHPIAWIGKPDLFEWRINHLNAKAAVVTLSRDDDDFSDVIIHIGYHKTGSTLLQRCLFTEDRGFASPWKQSFYHKNILLSRPDSQWPARIRDAFRDGIEAARDQQLTPVLSCEALSGDIWRLGQANGYGNFHVADALADAFPGARVLMVLREQVSMICSLYKHSIRSHWRYPLGEFLDQSALDYGMAPLLNLGYLEYSALAAHYFGLFGSQRVLAMPFERLNEPPAWSAELSAFTSRNVREDWFQSRENPGMSALAARIKRPLNYLIPATATPNRTPTGKFVSRLASKADTRLSQRAKRSYDRQLRARVQHYIGDHFAQDNRRLFQLVDDDWSRYGYPATRA